MAKIQTETLTFKISKLTKDTDPDTAILGEDIPSDVLGVLEQLVNDPSIIIEIAE